MIMHILARGATLGAILLAAVPADSSCQPPQGGTNGGDPRAGKACDMRIARSPWLSHEPGSQQLQVHATVHVECDPPLPQSHNMSVWLEREVGDGGTQWLIQGDISWAKTIPDSSGFDVTAAASCDYSKVTRRWRVLARAKGVGPSGTPFDWPLPESESRPTAIVCR